MAGPSGRNERKELYEYACHEGNARNLKLMTGVDVEH